jgi:rhodanese-related sulfurtransferase
VLALLMGLKTVSPQKLHQRMQSGGVTAIDMNSRESWLRARVPGALNLDPAGLAASDLPPDKASTLVFYCSNPMCSKAPNAARRARGWGFQDVLVMSAGIRGWLDAALPTESGEAASA